jgi:hypothetical protein
MKNKNTIPTEVQDEITYIPIPEGVDIDIVSEIIGDDMYDIIFLDEGIVLRYLIEKKTQSNCNRYKNYLFLISRFANRHSLTLSYKPN